LATALFHDRRAKLPRSDAPYLTPASVSPYRPITVAILAGSGPPAAVATSATSLKYWAPMSGVMTTSARAVWSKGLLKAWTSPRGVARGEAVFARFQVANLAPDGAAQHAFEAVDDLLVVAVAVRRGTRAPGGTVSSNMPLAAPLTTPSIR